VTIWQSEKAAFTGIELLKYAKSETWYRIFDAREAPTGVFLFVASRFICNLPGVTLKLNLFGFNY
jgi:hypothetical protein